MVIPGKKSLRSLQRGLPNGSPTFTLNGQKRIMEGPNNPRFAELLASAPPGPRIEFGVLYGDTLRQLANHDGITIGVDSFAGMGEPTEHDYRNGRCNYPKGWLSVDIRKVRSNLPDVNLIKGWVPQVLSDVPLHRFAFAHIDMDHYAPTRAAIEWLWDKMAPGGIMTCDDWFADNADILAARAIREIAMERRSLDGDFGRHAYWRF